MSKRAASPDPTESRRVKSRVPGPSVDDIFDKMVSEYNLKLLPRIEDDYLLSKVDSSLSTFAHNLNLDISANPNLAGLLYSGASSLWGQTVLPHTWLEVQSKYGLILQLLKAIVDTRTSFKVLRRLRKQTLLCPYD